MPYDHTTHISCLILRQSDKTLEALEGFEGLLFVILVWKYEDVVNLS